jgi:hypothetical protein
VLQQYFAHERLAEAALPHPAHAVPEPRRPVEPPTAPAGVGIRDRLRRLFGRRG